MARPGNRRQAAFLWSYLAYAVGHQGELERARSLLEQSQAHLRDPEDVRSFEAVFTMMVKGWIAYLAGELIEGTRWFTEAALSQAIDSRAILATTLAGMGEVAMMQEREDEALLHFREGLRYGHEIWFPPGIVLNLQGLARIAARCGQMERAGRMIGIINGIGISLRVLHGAGLAAYHDAVEQVRSALGDAAFASTQAAGAAMRLDHLLGEDV